MSSSKMSKLLAGEPAKFRLVLRDVDGEAKVESPMEDVKLADMPDWR